MQPTNSICRQFNDHEALGLTVPPTLLDEVIEYVREVQK